MDEIVISGLSGVFAQSDNVEEFAENLFNGVYTPKDVPHMPCKAGKIRDLTKFDAEFFGYQPHRVDVMDPNARIIMEKAYEALIDSGTNPTSLKGKNVGVYIAIHFLETEMLIYEKMQKGASLAISRSFNANRISYWLGVHGPSYIVDSACSSTLVALQTAYNAIKNGECDAALVGGCQVCLHPALFLHLLKVGVLDPTGISKVYDKSAGGFVKSEAIGVFYLQKANDAKRIYASVLNVRSNHDGNKPSFLAPSIAMQKKLLMSCYEECNIDPDSVAWIEAHSTGTQTGDGVEVTAIGEAFAERKTPLWIGSVKSNFGHAEAAAGVSSLTKVIVAMEAGCIPPNINLTELRDDIEFFNNGRIKVFTEKTAWTGGIVGVSGFGLGGANTHVILKSYEKSNGCLLQDNLPRLIAVSGRTQEGVDVILSYLENSPMDKDFIALLHEIHKHHIPLHSFRGFIILNDKGVVHKSTQDYEKKMSPLWFVFNSQCEHDWKSMYKYLVQFKDFEHSIQKCNDSLIEYKYNLIDAILGSKYSKFDSTVIAVSIQIALYDLLTSMNVVPDKFIGIGFGEIICAYADGCISIEVAMKLTRHFALLLSAVEDQTNKSVDLKLNMSDVDFGEKQSTIRWITSADNSSPIINHSYLLKTVLNPKKMDEYSDMFGSIALVVEMLSSNLNINDFLKEECSSLVLIKAGSTLEEFLTSLGLLNQYQEEYSSFVLIKAGSALEEFLTSVRLLYLYGQNPHYDKLYPPMTFPVKRGTKMIAPLVRWNHTTSWPVAFSSMQERLMSGERKVSISLESKEDSFLNGHEIDSNILFPGTGYLVLAWETLALIYANSYRNVSVIFENVRFLRATVIKNKDPITFHVMVHKGSGEFEIMESGHVVATGRVYVPKNVKNECYSVSSPEDSGSYIEGIEFYRTILIRNFNYKGAFRSVGKINSEGTRALIHWSHNWITFLDGMLQLNMLHDVNDSLTVPTEIEKIIIDVDKQSQYSNTDVLDAFMDKDVGIIESGGVQIKGCKLRPIPWKLDDKIPLVQKYLFTPYVSKDISVNSKIAAHLFAQIFMDNVGQNAKNVKIVEVLDETCKGRTLIASHFVEFARQQPIFEIQAKVYAVNNMNDPVVDGITISKGKLPLIQPVFLIIGSHILKNDQRRDAAIQSLVDSAFLVSREDSDTEINLIDSLVMCSEIKVDEEKWYLLKKKPKLSGNNKVINLTSVSYDWIKELQEALKVDYDRILLLAEGEPFSGVLGFYNSLRLERGTENVRCFFIPDAADFKSEELQKQMSKDLAVNVYKDKQWGCYLRYSLDEASTVMRPHAFVSVKTTGKKRSLHWSEGPINDPLNPNEENLIHVYYAAVNSTDALVFQNRLAVEALVENPYEKKDYAFGMEFSGHMQNGKRCMCLKKYGCLSTFVRMKKDDYFNLIPDDWSLEEAATVPIAYYTAISALILSSNVKNGDNVLVHTAGSLAGQAAIIISKYYNCNIFATVSSVDEKLFVQETFPFLPESRIALATNCSFEQMVLSETNGKGVQIVLNTLPEDKVVSSVNCMASDGHFIQLKRLDMHRGSGIVKNAVSKNISFHTAVLEDLLNFPADKKKTLRLEMDNHIKNGAVKPISRTVFGFYELDSAFELALSPKNFTKCVLQIKEEDIADMEQLVLRSVKPRINCDAEKSYIICGGLGGMGMELADWLVSRGAKKIVITSRTGETNVSQNIRIRRWKSYGVQTVISNADISNRNETEKLLREADALGSVDGIFNLAASLDDRMFKNQTEANFAASASAKLAGTLHLDECSHDACPALRHFVVFSSIASGYGNVGQTNYAMANSAAERICERRIREGLPAVCIQWGAVGNVGMFVKFVDGNINKPYAGNYMQPMKSCLDVLERCMLQNSSIVASLIVAK